jgi:hypothetical protein
MSVTFSTGNFKRISKILSGKDEALYQIIREHGQSSGVDPTQ